MSGHDLIVVGASAGGIEALMQIVRKLPGDLPAALFVVIHMPAQGPSYLAEVLSSAGRLPALVAQDRMPVSHGRILVPPPDHHLLVEPGHVHVVRGPKENGFRPAVDALFRTAAHSYGPRVVGVVLTGMLDDGTAGLLAVKRRGGVAVVQDPADASFPDMPESARRYVDVDYLLPLSAIPDALLELTRQPVANAAVPPLPAMLREVGITAMDEEALNHAADGLTPAPLVCPDCGGVLAEYYDGDLLRFRCQVGHGFSPQSLLDGQSSKLDRTLWAAYTGLGEREYLAQRLLADAEAMGDQTGRRRFGALLREARTKRDQVLLALRKAMEEEGD